MSDHNRNDDLAYGDDYRNRSYEGQDADRGIIGDAFRKMKTKHQQSSHGQPQSGPSAQQYYGQTGSSGPTDAPGQQPYSQSSYVMHSLS